MFDYHSDTLYLPDLAERFEELEGEREALDDALEELLTEVEEMEERMSDEDDDANDEDGELSPEVYAVTAAEKEVDRSFEIESMKVRIQKMRAGTNEWEADNREEFEEIKELLEELRGYGGDFKWRGDWYPQTLIDEDYFVEYAEELAGDLGMLENHRWPYTRIDWGAAARELRNDYSSVDFRGRTYYYN